MAKEARRNTLYVTFWGSNEGRPGQHVTRSWSHSVISVAHSMHMLSGSLMFQRTAGGGQGGQGSWEQHCRCKRDSLQCRSSPFNGTPVAT